MPLPKTMTVCVIDRYDQTPLDFVVDLIKNNDYEESKLYYGWLFNTFGYRVVHTYLNQGSDQRQEK